MRLCIVEPDASGHRMVLSVRNICRAAQPRGWLLQLITTEEAKSQPGYRSVVEEFGGVLQVVYAPAVRYPADNPSSLDLLHYQVAQWASFRAAYRGLAPAAQPHFVYLNSLTYVDKVLPLLGSPFGPTPFGGMLLAGSFHHRRLGLNGPGSRGDRLYGWLFRRMMALPTLRTVAYIDEPFAAYAASLPACAAGKLHFVPDAAGVMAERPSKAQARAELGIGSGCFVVLVYGALTERKGLAQLMRATADPSVPETLVLLVAGPQDAAIEADLKSAQAAALRSQGRLIEINRFVSDAEEATVFAAADVVWLGYWKFYGMSGVLVSAASCGLPVVSCRAGVLGWMTQKYGLGELMNPEDADEVRRVLARLSDPHLREQYGHNGQVMAARHSGNRFGEAICDWVAGSTPRLVPLEGGENAV